VVLLHHLVAVASTGLAPGPDEDASHLCHHATCRTIGHVIWESKMENQNRKGCIVWVDCPHCSKKVSACAHSPKCVKPIPGVAWEQFRSNPDLYLHVL